MTLLRNLLVITILALFAVATAHAAESTIDLSLVKIKFTAPDGFKENEGTPPSFFSLPTKASIQFLATAMPMADAQLGAMHKAILDSGKAQVAAGVYASCEEVTVDGFKGVLIVESAKDPSIRRMQWQAYGRGGYFNFTMASQTDAFEGHLPAFKAALSGIKFVK